MAVGDFPKALAAFWSFDGFRNDQAPGEHFLTAYGVTQTSWNAAIEQGVIASKSITAATKADCQTILHVMFWNALRCEELTAGIDLLAFNDGTLSGVGHAARLLQRCAGVTDDGIIGPVTLAAVKAKPVGALVESIEKADDAYLAALASAPLYLRGWTRREAFMTKTALEWASVAAA